MADFVIRPVAMADLPVLLLLVQALTRHHGDVPGVTTESLIRDFLGPKPWFYGLVAEAGDTVVGYAALLPRARLGFGQRGLDLHHLFVAEDARDKGIGTALVGRAVEVARELGCAYVIVGVHPQNVQALGYYPRLGFQRDQGEGGVRFFQVL